MQPKFFFATILTCLFSLSGCNEKPVEIPEFEVPKGTRNILIEEFTGVQCVNCPNGAAIIEEMVAELGERVVPISIHHGFFAKPLPESRQDLHCHCGYGDAVVELLGSGPIGYPAAVINRSKLGSKLFPNKDEWKSLVLNELKKSTPINLFVKTHLDTNTRQVTMDLTLAATEPVDDLFISAVLLENDIVDAQILPSGEHDENYHFQHVVRMPITDPEGEALLALDKGEIRELKGFKQFDISEAWDMMHCSIAVFVHHKSTSKEVLQALSQELR